MTLKEFFDWDGPKWGVCEYAVYYAAFFAFWPVAIFGLFVTTCYDLHG